MKILTTILFFVVLVLSTSELRAQNCNFTVSNIQKVNIDEGSSFDLKFTIVSNSKFEVNLFDNNSENYILNTSKIIPEFNKVNNVTLEATANNFIIKGIDKKVIEHKLYLVLISKSGNCSPSKFEIK